MHHHDVWHAYDAGNRCDVAEKTEVEVRVERRVDRAHRADQQQRITIRGRAYDGLCPDIARTAGPVFNDELLAQTLRQPLTHQASQDVGRPTCSERHDDANRPRWIGLRPNSL